MKPRALSEIPERFHAEIMQQLLKPDPVKTTTPIPAIPVPVQASRLRQDTKGLNKTEAEFLAYLEGRYVGRVIHAQSITLTLANGVRYTPDFFCGQLGPANKPIFWETKGFMRDDASVKIKVAARVHEWAAFYLVTKIPKKKGGGWDMQKVLA